MVEFELLSTIVGGLSVAFILSPFFFTAPSRLESASAEGSSETLLNQQQGILKRYIDEENLFNNGEMSRSVWKRRQLYLIGRYVDAARRVDHLKAVEEGNV